jgi:hypothetical protein
LVLTILLANFKQITGLQQANPRPPTTAPTVPAINAKIIKALISFALAVFWWIFQKGQPGLREVVVPNFAETLLVRHPHCQPAITSTESPEAS